MVKMNVILGNLLKEELNYTLGAQFTTIFNDAAVHLSIRQQSGKWLHAAAA